MLLTYLLVAGVIHKESVTSFDIKALRKSYPGMVTSLHSGVPCISCGMRFRPDELETTVFKDHLDWHFRMNKRGKGSGPSSNTRGWHYAAIDWIQYEDVYFFIKKTNNNIYYF